MVAEINSQLLPFANKLLSLYLAINLINLRTINSIVISLLSNRYQGYYLCQDWPFHQKIEIRDYERIKSMYEYCLRSFFRRAIFLFLQLENFQQNQFICTILPMEKRRVCSTLLDICDFIHMRKILWLAKFTDISLEIISTNNMNQWSAKVDIQSLPTLYFVLFSILA